MVYSLSPGARQLGLNPNFAFYLPYGLRQVIQGLHDLSLKWAQNYPPLMVVKIESVKKHKGLRKLTERSKCSISICSYF